MGRIYADRISLNPPSGDTGPGRVDIIAVVGDPNGVVSGSQGDRAFQIASLKRWVCQSGTTWVLDDPSSLPGITQFIYRPEGTADPDAGVYITWATVHEAAAAAAVFGLVEIIVDNTLSQPDPPEVTAGTWDMNNIKLVGLTSPLLTGTPLAIGAGVVFENWTRGADYLAVTYTSATPLYTLSHVLGLNFVRTGERSSFKCAGVGRIWRLASGAGNMIMQLDAGSSFPSFTEPVIENLSTNSIIIMFDSGSAIQADTLAGTGNYSLQNIHDNNNFESTQTDLGGTATALYLNPALMDLVSGDWDGDPTSIGEAINRLAAAVEGLLAAPIP